MPSIPYCQLANGNVLIKYLLFLLRKQSWSFISNIYGWPFFFLNWASVLHSFAPNVCIFSLVLCHNNLISFQLFQLYGFSYSGNKTKRETKLAKFCVVICFYLIRQRVFYSLISTG